MMQTVGGYRRARGAAAALGLACLAVALATPAVSAQAVRGGYMYTLSTFTGPIKVDFGRVVVDRHRNEVYALYGNLVRVFNASGMEVYRFGEDLAVGRIVDVTIDDAGDILILAYRDEKPHIVRCNYRGQPVGTITLQGLPQGFADLGPNRMIHRNGRIFFVALGQLKAVTTDRDGRVEKAYDFFELFGLEEKHRDGTAIGGFDVDTDGNMLLTIPVLFQAFVVAPDGEFVAFGKPGGGPGRFNIVGGIARDSKGNLLVVDRLKSSVLVFDRKFTFVTQFATRGYKPPDLVFPDDLALGPDDRVYVTQAARRGISVFQLAYR